MGWTTRSDPPTRGSLAGLEPARRTWIRRRWAALRPALGESPREAWARRQIRDAPLGDDLLEDGGPLDTAGPATSLDRARGKAARALAGQVFTPQDVADLMAARLPAELPGPVLDPACGDGRLLTAVVRARLGMGAPLDRALEAVVGWDVDPVAVLSARLSLVELALETAEGGPLPPLALSPRDALADARDPEAGFGAVIANPPYLEAKRMASRQPALRERLRRALPTLVGAWDLYLAFAALALRRVGPGGHAVLLLPNKILQARYAARFRRAVQDGRDGWRLAGVVDLSRAEPRPFPGTGVYPVILHLVRDGARRPWVAARVDRRPAPAEPPATRVGPDELDRLGGEAPWFVPRRTWPRLSPLLDGPRLGEVAAVRSTCSFHARGLRERFVTRERPEGPGVHPYLGGPSRTRRTEVDCFRIRWAGWWIRHDNETLRRDHGNALPPLETFLRPKVVLCQHGRRLRPAADREGRFVTKDVYPVAFPTDLALELDALLAVLASTVATALYNTVFHGITCGSDTLHYLPIHLVRLPVPPPDHPALREAAAAARRLEGEGPPDGATWAALDRAVARAYGLDPACLPALVAEHLLRVGAARPDPAAHPAGDGSGDEGAAPG